MIQIGKKVLFVLFSILLLLSCVSKNNLHGVFVVRFDKNIDSIELLENGEYIRKIYDARTNQLIFKNKSTWDYTNSEITFKKFLENKGELTYRKSISNYDKYLMSYYSLPVGLSLGGVTLELDNDLKYYYIKQ